MRSFCSLSGSVKTRGTAMPAPTRNNTDPETIRTPEVMLVTSSASPMLHQ
jgi:hypothetical protein